MTTKTILILFGCIALTALVSAPVSADTVEDAVSEDIRVIESEYDDETNTFTIELENSGTLPETVYLASVFDPDAGTDNVQFDSVRMHPNETTSVEIQAPEIIGQSAVFVYVDGGDGTVIRSDTADDLPDVNLGLGVAIGLATAIIGIGIAVNRRYSGKYSEIEEVH